ncbi:MAG: insulinase family protein [Candidatus Zixiibacteriota bacterium]|nr:MAG: insulinase family protein [candidate division Zixibacteria bacterium]
MVATKKTRKDSSEYRKTTLRNGLRVVTERLPSVRSISIGVWVDVGSRNETTEENGLSHFIEHLVFKGTKHKSAKQIASSLESIGGSLNAFTSREHTCFTARVLDEHLVEAVDILADITCHATMTPTNIKRERLVICEEIKESRDNPTDHVHDIFARAFWGDHPLGQPIMGSQEIIMGMPRARLVKYLARHYRAESIVIAASGSVSHQKLVKLVREKFSFPDGIAESSPTAIRMNPQRVLIESEDSNQTQFCVGFPGVSYRDNDKMAVLALATHLGGGMSSVLFQKIREQRGLAYSVYCYHDFFRDHGLFGVYLGTDQTHLRQAYDLIIAECRRMKRHRLSSVVLDQAKAQLKGHLTIGLEATTNRMARLGRRELVGENYQSLEQSIKQIDMVTPSDVQSLAVRVLDESQMTVTALGPVEKGTFDDIG